MRRRGARGERRVVCIWMGDMLDVEYVRYVYMTRRWGNRFVVGERERGCG